MVVSAADENDAVSVVSAAAALAWVRDVWSQRHPLRLPLAREQSDPCHPLPLASSIP